MTSYIDWKVNLTDNQKLNLAKSINNKCPLTLRIKYSNFMGNDELMFSISQLKKIKRAMENGKGVDIKISKTQIRKIAKEGGKSILDVIHNEEFDKDNSDFIKDYFINMKC